MPKNPDVDENGDEFFVTVSCGFTSSQNESAPTQIPKQNSTPILAIQEITASLEGNYHRTKSGSEAAIKVGDTVNEGVELDISSS
jgi:biotin carboxyl carrier protein